MTVPVAAGVRRASRAISRYGSPEHLNRACIHVYPASAASSSPILAAAAIVVATPTPSAPKRPRQTAASVALATWFNTDGSESSGP